MRYTYNVTCGDVKFECADVQQVVKEVNKHTGLPVLTEAMVFTLMEFLSNHRSKMAGDTPHQNWVSPRAPQGHSARPPLAHGPWPSGTPVIASPAVPARPQWSAACRLMRIAARRVCQRGRARPARGRSCEYYANLRSLHSS